MTILRVTLIFALVLPMPISAMPKNNDVSGALAQTLPKGWECLQGPNSLDRPGRVFYLDKQGVRFELGDVGNKINAQAGELAAVSAGTSGRVSAGLLAKILGIIGLSLNFNKAYATSITLSERQEFRTDEANTRAALKTLDPALFSDENTYYVIRNTQVAKQMRLTVDRSVAAAFGGDIPFSNAVKVSGAATPAPAATPTPAPSTSPTPSPSPSPSASATPAASATPVPAATAAIAAPKAATTPTPATTGTATISLGAGGTPSVTGGLTLGAAPKPAASATPAAGATPATATASASNGPPAIISAQNAKTYTIDQTFTTPLTVCFLAQKFTVRNITGGVAGSVRVARLEDVYWTPSQQTGASGAK